MKTLVVVISRACIVRTLLHDICFPSIAPIQFENVQLSRSPSATLDQSVVVEGDFM